jgi:hypothetical protein
VDLEPGRACRDRQPLIAELSDDVERLARRLLEREPQLVRRHGALDLGTYVRGGAEEAVRGDKSVERLMRPLEVVVADEVFESALGVVDVREYGAAEKLVPQRLPESLDLAERLRVLRSTADVVDASSREQFLEFGLAAPHRVLPAVVGEHLGRVAVRGDAALERLHHQRRLLVMSKRVPDDEAAVVIHEHAHVQPLCASQPKREDVRLPQLVRCGTLEAARLVLPLRRRLRCLDKTLVVQDAPDDLFGHAERLEAREHVADPSRAPVLVFTLERDDLFARSRARCHTLGARLPAFGLEPSDTLCAKRSRPLAHRGNRDTERLRDVGLRSST